MKDKINHVIVGGGFGGLRVARLLAGRSDIQVTIINPQTSFEYHGSLYRSANGYSPLETIIPYREIFSGSNVTYIQDYMVDIHPAQKRIALLSGHQISYDSVTLALGYEPEYFAVPGMREFSNTLYSLADALELRKKLAVTAQESFSKSMPAKIIVAGAGPTGVEVAASVSYFFNLLTGDQRVDVTLIEAQDRILGGLSPDFSHVTEQDITGQIDIQCAKKVIRATKDLLYFADSPALPFDVLIWTAGSSANGYFRQRPDLFEVDRKGRVIVDDYLQTKYDAMYVIGDSAAAACSGTAHAAVEMGEYVANHVIAQLENRHQTAYCASQPDYAVPTGHDTAVAMSGNSIISGHDGWKIRRELDLQALSLIAPEDVAQNHWKKGESLAALFDA